MWVLTFFYIYLLHCIALQKVSLISIYLLRLNIVWLAFALRRAVCFAHAHVTIMYATAILYFMLYFDLCVVSQSLLGDNSRRKSDNETERKAGTARHNLQTAN